MVVAGDPFGVRDAGRRAPSAERRRAAARAASAECVDHGPRIRVTRAAICKRRSTRRKSGERRGQRGAPSSLRSPPRRRGASGVVIRNSGTLPPKDARSRRRTRRRCRRSCGRPHDPRGDSAGRTPLPLVGIEVRRCRAPVVPPLCNWQGEQVDAVAMRISAPLVRTGCTARHSDAQLPALHRAGTALHRDRRRW